MDWRSVSFDWNRLRAFVVTAEEGTFSAAARALGASQPTIGRQVAALEEELGITLFERVGTRLNLTASGVELLEHARVMAEAAMRVSRVAAGQSTTVEGDVVVTASEAISSFWLPPIVAGLRRDHPGIHLEVVATNETRDLHRREADIAIRNTRPTHPDLVARRLRDAEAGLYGTPDLLRRSGPLETADDIVQHAQILTFDRGEGMLAALHGAGVPVTPANFSVVSANHLVMWALCKQGTGLAFMMSELGDADPDVVRVMPSLGIPFQNWLVCHRELRTSRRLRIVFDRIVDALGPPRAETP